MAVFAQRRTQGGTMARQAAGHLPTRTSILLGLAILMTMAVVADCARSSYVLRLPHGRALRGSDVKEVEFQGVDYPESKYKNGDKPDTDCSQFPEQNYNWIAALGLGCKPPSGEEGVKIHNGDDVPGCTVDWMNPYDCPKTYDGEFDTCLSIVSGAVSGDNPTLSAYDGTWLTWNSKDGACYIYGSAACENLSDEDSNDNSFQHCGFT